MSKLDTRAFSVTASGDANAALAVEFSFRLSTFELIATNAQQQFSSMISAHAHTASKKKEANEQKK